MTQQQIPEWVIKEVEEINTQRNYETLPTLKLTPNVVTELIVDITKPFENWKGQDTKGNPTTKKIIPVLVNGVRMNWWLNVKNPTYREIMNYCKEGKNSFKILQTGTQAETKYVLVK